MNINFFIKTGSIILIFFFMSCNSTKSSDLSKHENYIEKGYLVGEIEKHTGECKYIILDKKNNIKYDPVNIEDADFSNLKLTKNSLYFKFNRLRRTNRCGNISPIYLIDVILIE